MIGKPVIEQCFKWTRNGVKKTKKTISSKCKRPSLAVPTTDSTLETGENQDESHLYATITKESKQTKKQRRSLSNDSDFSASDTAVEETGVLSVELHAYQTVNLELHENSAMLKEIRTRSENNDGQIIDETSGSKIYDEVG